MESTTSSTPAHPVLWAALSDEQVVEAIRQADRDEKAAAARKLGAIGEAHARGLGVAVGAANTQQWVAGMLRAHPAEAGSWVKLAQHVDRELPATAAALEAGAISLQHARVISKAVQDLRDEVSTP